jgi:hypothetical protein
MIPAFYQDKVIIRFVICGLDPEEKDIEYAWKEVKIVTDEMFAEIEAEKLQNELIQNEEEIKDKVNIIMENFSKTVTLCDDEKTKH